jgi:hypothetical protein
MSLEKMIYLLIISDAPARMPGRRDDRHGWRIVEGHVAYEKEQQIYYIFLANGKNAKWKATLITQKLE